MNTCSMSNGGKFLDRIDPAWPLDRTMEKIQLSVIIPVLHESHRINHLIDHLHSLEADKGCEIIVVDGSPERDTLEVIRSEQVIKIDSEKGRAQQMNAGATVAKGEVLIFLHVDTELPAGAFTKIASVMQQDEYVGGAFELGIKSEKFVYRVLEYWVAIRCRLTRIPYGDQAIFIRRNYFKKIGGYRDIPLMEDIELMRRIKAAGDKIYIIPDRVATSPRRWEQEGFIYVNLRNTVQLTLYYLGLSPKKFARLYKNING
jgi:rSAM/selenodomain-associated transferase 2